MSKLFGSDNTEGRVRYADYIEDIHKKFLNKTDKLRKKLTSYTQDNEPIEKSPYGDYVDIEVDDAFFGVGFMLSSFPSLYDMYGKFMAGLDVEVLYGQIFEDTVNSPQVNDMVAAEGVLMDDEIETSSLPRLKTGMRDINSVMSSSFIIGKSLIEDARTKAISKFSAELKYRLIPIAVERWTKHLEWNRINVSVYAEIMKTYYTIKTQVQETNYSFAARDLMWPFTILDFERVNLAALQGATNSSTTQQHKPGMFELISKGAGLLGIAGLFV